MRQTERTHGEEEASMARRLGCVLVLALLALAGCAQSSGSNAGPQPSAVKGADGILRTAGCETATVAPAPTVDGTPQFSNQGDLDSVVSQLEPYAQQHFADVYSGVEVRLQTNRLRVYRVPSAAFDAWLTSTYTRTCIEVADGKHSEKELTALANRIAGDLTYWQSVGIPVWTISPLYDGSAVQVGTTNVAGANRELPLRYGADAPLVVVYSEAPTAVSTVDIKSQNRAN
jgi:hypothetical protein